MLFTAEELQALSASPRQRVATSLQHESDQSCRDAIQSAAAGYQGLIKDFASWPAELEKSLATACGPQAVASVAEAGSLAAAIRANRLSAAADPDGSLQAALSAVTSGDRQAALRSFDRLLTILRKQHDTHRDRVTMYLSAIYRIYGADAVEAVLRDCGERTFLQRLPAAISDDARTRLTTWVNIWHNNFCGLRIQEEETRFVVHQTPCGSCGRQISGGRYQPPLDLAVVAEPHAVTLGRGMTPIYRTHVAAYHFLLPLDKIGVPWPVVDCPAGLAAGPCRALIYKDPLDPAALDEEPVRRLLAYRASLAAAACSRP